MGNVTQSGSRGGQFEVSIGSLDEPNKTVYAQYRPAQLQIDKSMQWSKQRNNNGQEEKDLQLAFGEPTGRVTSLELFFDAAETKNTSVEDAINDLTYLTKAQVQGTDPKKVWRTRPHHCVLVFGNVYRREVFKCVIESMSTKISMFSADGTPIRATVTLKVREANSVALAAEDEAPVAPSSQAPGAGSASGPSGSEASGSDGSSL